MQAPSVNLNMDNESNQGSECSADIKPLILYLDSLDPLRKEIYDQDPQGHYKAALGRFFKEIGSPNEPDLVYQDLESGFKNFEALTSGGMTIIPAQRRCGIIDNISKFVRWGNAGMKCALESIGLVWFAISMVSNGIAQHAQLYDLFKTGLGDTIHMLKLARHFGDLYRGRPRILSMEPAERIFSRIRKPT